jgi:hypothetical protein
MGRIIARFGPEKTPAQAYEDVGFPGANLKRREACNI